MPRVSFDESLNEVHEVPNREELGLTAERPKRRKAKPTRTPEEHKDRHLLLLASVAEKLPEERRLDLELLNVAIESAREDWQERVQRYKVFKHHAMNRDDESRLIYAYYLEMHQPAAANCQCVQCAAETAQQTYKNLHKRRHVEFLRSHG